MLPRVDGPSLPAAATCLIPISVLITLNGVPLSVESGLVHEVSSMKVSVLATLNPSSTLSVKSQSLPKFNDVVPIASAPSADTSSTKYAWYVPSVTWNNGTVSVLPPTGVTSISTIELSPALFKAGSSMMTSMT